MTSLPPSPLREEDYEAIEAAVMETARGRWFLAEYTRRNRNSDTRTVLDAIEKLERSMGHSSAGPRAEHFSLDLMDMSAAIERTRQELATLAAEKLAEGRITVAGSELDAVVESTEAATQEILAAAEKIQETAWVLREQGTDGHSCDELDAKATDIYMACSFQDLTGQRISKVVQTLRYLDGRISAMLDSLGIAPAPIEVADTHTQIELENGRHLLNGPARPGEGLSQTNIDTMLVDDAELFAQTALPTPQPIPAPAPVIIEAAAPLNEEPAIAPEAPDEAASHAIAPDNLATPDAQALALRNIARQATPQTAPHAQTARPSTLPDFTELSFEEKVALFS
jgi:chemotaxis regulatin CheY-phosphate phosphatase CheZ